MSDLVRTYAEQVRALRLWLGLTQAELGKRLGAHPKSVSEWERGVSIPQRRFRRKLARLLSTMPGSITDPESEEAA